MTKLKYVSAAATGPNCITSCATRHITQGKYQSCFTCSEYFECVFGGLVENTIPCDTTKQFDDNFQGCVVSSSTCDISEYHHIYNKLPVVWSSVSHFCDQVSFYHEFYLIAATICNFYAFQKLVLIFCLWCQFI